MCVEEQGSKMRLFFKQLKLFGCDSKGNLLAQKQKTPEVGWLMISSESKLHQSSPFLLGFLGPNLLPCVDTCLLRE